MHGSGVDLICFHRLLLFVRRIRAIWFSVLIVVGQARPLAGEMRRAADNAPALQIAVARSIVLSLGRARPRLPAWND